MLLGNVGQQLDINNLESTVDQMRSALNETRNLDRRQEDDIGKLKQENHELKLYLATLVRLLVAKGIVQQEEVDVAVQAVEKI